MILDIILIAIAAVLVIIGIRRGIARTLLNLLSVAVSGVLAYFVSKIAANWVYSSYISQTVTKSVMGVAAYYLPLKTDLFKAVGGAVA